MESGGRPKKEATAAEINLRAIIKMKIGGCPLFCNSGKAGMYQHSQSEGAAWHRRWHSKGIGDVPPTSKTRPCTYGGTAC